MTIPMAGSGAVDRLVVVAGPTGTGKSDLAVALAQQLNGEVVNADSMQLYRGMDIGTAKLTDAERAGVPHHLLDVLDVTQAASVASYQFQARMAIERILSAGRTPILVGGSGLYIQSVIDEISFPGTDPELRAQFLDRLETHGSVALHVELASVDPVAADHILPTDGRRIVRALEVVALTGAPFSASLPSPGPARYDAVLLTLDRDTDLLDRRLAQRVELMVRTGLVAEVAGLLERGLRNGPTARKALGYQQFIGVVDGTSTLQQAVEATVTATRRFVRRQRSWFRRDRRRTELDGADPELVSAALTAIRAR